MKKAQETQKNLFESENVRKRQYRKDVVYRYSNYINELCNTILTEKIFTLKKITDKHSVSNGIPTILTELNIIKRTDYGIYKWIGRKPDYNMILEVLESSRTKKSRMINEHKNSIIEKTIEKQIEKPIENIIEKKIVRRTKKLPVIEVKKPSVKISLFWGMINFNKE